jgi:hypothetical protein
MRWQRHTAIVSRVEGLLQMGPADLVKGVLNSLLLESRRNLWRLHPLRFSRQLDRVPIDRPIFLLGVQGGGLTLLSRMLHRHSQAVFVTGSRANWAGPDEMQNVMGPALPPELAGLHHQIPPHSRYPHRDWLYAIDELLPLYRKTARDATPEMALQFQRAIRFAVALHSHDPNRARFVDKSQSFTVRLSLVNALLNGREPQFILVTRNPYAVVFRAAARATRISQMNLSLEGRLRLAAEHWRNSFQCALEDEKEVEHFTTARFEDLLREPEDCLRALCTFAELSYEPEMLPAADHRIPLGSTGSARGDRKWYPLRSDVNRPYLTSLQPWMIEIVDNYVRGFAERWNYSPEGP